MQFRITAANALFAFNIAPLNRKKDTAMLKVSNRLIVKWSSLFLTFSIYRARKYQARKAISNNIKTNCRYTKKYCIQIKQRSTLTEFK